MPATIGDVMTRDPIALDADLPAVEAAKCMAQEDIGDVIVTENGKVCGIVTDRDIVVRVLANGGDAQSTPLREICSRDVVTLSPTDLVENAVQLMRTRAIRRLPVVENEKPVGIISIGDLAINRDPESALADISTATPNH